MGSTELYEEETHHEGKMSVMWTEGWPHLKLHRSGIPGQWVGTPRTGDQGEPYRGAGRTQRRAQQKGQLQGPEMPIGHSGPLINLVWGL